MIKEKNFRQPDEDKQAFDILAHEYGRIDNKLVFHSLAEELIPDAQEFIDIVVKLK